MHTICFAHDVHQWMAVSTMGTPCRFTARHMHTLIITWIDTCMRIYSHTDTRRYTGTPTHRCTLTRVHTREVQPGRDPGILSKLWLAPEAGVPH